MNAIACQPANDVTPNPHAAAIAREEARLAAVAEGHYTGSRYVQGRDVAEVAKDIRRDIAAAVKAGELPAIRCTVRTRRYSMGRSIDVEVTAVPAGLIVANVRRALDDDCGEPWMSAAGRGLLMDLEAIVNRYNFDKSDIATDYHNCAFYGSVEFAHPLVDAQRAAIRQAARG